MINDTLAVLFVIAGTLTASAGFAWSMDRLEGFFNQFSRKKAVLFFADVQRQINESR